MSFTDTIKTTLNSTISNLSKKIVLTKTYNITGPTSQFFDNLFDIREENKKIHSVELPVSNFNGKAYLTVKVRADANDDLYFYLNNSSLSVPSSGQCSNCSWIGGYATLYSNVVALNDISHLLNNEHNYVNIYFYNTNGNLDYKIYSLSFVLKTVTE